ncbi:MAG: hypothetical protein A2219_00630 [Elusimicrobia bacterium RIFOXYA2_FULL_50_26]|nr:MAG: hypothetical protein A2219_00630 [Elusimicrobia bacterium RIFOXYA2_FULL_50_26]OGS22850.1 MAG: hypothetical protein A2314_02255 [Elusimicrobia bacterium RIFOXYB2_FULL_50_12]
MDTLKILIEELKQAGTLKDTIASWVCPGVEDIVRRQKLSVSWTAALIDDEVLVTGEIAGDITLECGRCVEEYSSPVLIKFQQAYPATVPEIDLQDELRQLLILHVPLKPLCKTECAGICQVCGKNRNLAPCRCPTGFPDQRWEKLKLKK